MRWLLVLSLAAALVACKGGNGSEDTAEDPGADEVEETDTAADTVTDTRPDPVDTAWDPEDVVDDEVVAICGNREVEPGEECDPPLTTTACTTTCGSWGTGACTAECLAPGPADCTPPDETCNLVDDDCDGLTDESTMAGWSSAVTLMASAATSAQSMDLAWTGSAFAAAWVVDGTPDAIHLAVVDQTRATILPSTSLPIDPGNVEGRVALAWTGSELMLAWNTSSDERHVAFSSLAASVGAHSATSTPGLASSPDISWSASHAALTWVEEVSSSRDVHMSFVQADGAEGSLLRITTSADATGPRVDADTSAVAITWIDRRSGAAQVHRAVIGHDASTIAADAALTTTGSVSLAGISAPHRLVAWSDDRDGTPRIYGLPLDTSWNPTGTETTAADGTMTAMASTPGRIAVATGPGLLALEGDGTAASAALTLALTEAHALEWGDLLAGAAGGAGPDLVITFAGCGSHESCTSWTPVLETTETRTAWDLYTLTLGHDAAITGSWSSRPVTYLSIQIYQDAPYSGPDSTGSAILTDEPYETCGLCVLVYEDCSTSTCGRTYLARSGRLDITAIGATGDTFAGTLRNVQLGEVIINSTTRESTWVEDGSEICLGSYTFSETID